MWCVSTTARDASGWGTDWQARCSPLERGGAAPPHDPTNAAAAPSVEHTCGIPPAMEAVWRGVPRPRPAGGRREGIECSRAMQRHAAHPPGSNERAMQLSQAEHTAVRHRHRHERLHVPQPSKPGPARVLFRLTDAPACGLPLASLPLHRNACACTTMRVAFKLSLATLPPARCFCGPGRCNARRALASLPAIARAHAGNNIPCNMQRADATRRTT